MTIDETLIDLREAADLPVFRRRGKALHVSVLYRWIHAGILARDGGRVRLEVIKVPSGLKTSTEAVARFITRLNGHEPTTTPAAQRRAHEVAAHELETAGFVVGP